jgi:hypothetical protein
MSGIDETRPLRPTSGRHQQIGVGIPDQHGIWHRVICKFDMTCVRAPDVLHPEVDLGMRWPTVERVEVLAECCWHGFVNPYASHGIFDDAEQTHDLCGFCWIGLRKC